MKSQFSNFAFFSVTFLVRLVTANTSIHIVELIPPVVSECDPTRGELIALPRFSFVLYRAQQLIPPLFQNVT